MTPRAHLKGTTVLPILPVPAPTERLDALRFEIAKRALGREPFVFRHPWTGAIYFVEGEPADWREQASDIIHAAYLRMAKTMGGMH